MKVSTLLKDYLSHNKAFFNQLKTKKSIDIRKDIDFSLLSEKIHADYAPVFVLSTGRNGTMLLTHLLEISKESIALHEPVPELSMPSKLAYENFEKNPEFVKGMFEGARYEMLRTAFLMNKKYIETNNRITFFAHHIAEIYPKAKFIHLIRNPESFIKSGIGRNWYSGETLYDEARIIPIGNSDWSNMNQYDKIAWLWNETNQFIEGFKAKNPSRVLTVFAEDLFKKVEASRVILKFCSITDISDSNIKKIIAVKTNAGKRVDVDKDKLRGALEKYAPLMAKYNY